jgi:hypothetical protein
LARANRESHVRTVTIRPRFTLEGTYQGILTNGRYVLLSEGRSEINGEAVTGPLLIDTRSGRRTTVSGCDSAPLGFDDVPWLWSFPCSATGRSSVQLYSLRSGVTSSASINVAGCGNEQSQFSACGVGPVGAVWAAISLSCYHCTTSTVLENVATGQIRGLPHLAPNQVLDLNAPSARRRLCWPLRRTAELQPSTDANGSLALGAPTGRSAIVSSTTNQEYFERCGSHRITALRHAVVTANSHAIVFADPTGAHPLVLPGMLIPSMRPFKILLPRAFGTPTTNNPHGFIGTVVLSAARIYVQSTQNQIYSAPFRHTHLP